MKRLIKKVLAAVAMAAILGTTMVGCGSGTEPAATDTEDTTAVTEGETSTTEEGGEVSAMLQKCRDDGYITIASSNDAPLSYIDVTTGEYTGIDGEIFKDLMNRLGVPEVKMKQVAFESMLIELNNKSVDMVVDAMYIKPERQEIAQFTNVWYTEGDCVIVKSDSTITGLDDLKDKVVGAQKGTAFLEIAQKWLAEGKIKDVIIMGAQSELMLAVNTGKVDACVTDSIIGGYSLAQDSSLDLKFAENYEPDSVGRIGAAVRFEDADFCKEINAELDKMKEDGTIMKYLEEYGMGENGFVSVEDGQTPIVE